jgi:hypothetical protein
MNFIHSTSNFFSKYQHLLPVTPVRRIMSGHLGSEGSNGDCAERLQPERHPVALGVALGMDRIPAVVGEGRDV